MHHGASKLCMALRGFAWISAFRDGFFQGGLGHGLLPFCSRTWSQPAVGLACGPGAIIAPPESLKPRQIQEVGFGWFWMTAQNDTEWHGDIAAMNRNCTLVQARRWLKHIAAEANSKDRLRNTSLQLGCSSSILGSCLLQPGTRLAFGTAVSRPSLQLLRSSCGRGPADLCNHPLKVSRLGLH